MSEPIKPPSGKELKAAEAAGERLCKYYNGNEPIGIATLRVIAEDDIATHTRHEGQTAEYWYALWELENQKRHNAELLLVVLKQHAEAAERVNENLRISHHEMAQKREAAEARIAEMEKTLLTEFLGKPVAYWLAMKNLEERQMLNREGTITRIAELERDRRTVQAEALRWRGDKFMERMTDVLYDSTKSALHAAADGCYASAAAIERGDVMI